MSKSVRRLVAFVAAAICAGVLAPGLLRAQGSTSNQQNRVNNQGNVPSQQTAAGEEQQNPLSSPLPPNPEGDLPYMLAPGPPPPLVNPPSYEDQYTNQLFNPYEDQEESQIIDQEEGPSQGGGGPGLSPGQETGGAQEGPDYIGPDGIINNTPPCQKQSQHQDCGQSERGAPPV